MKNKKIRCRKFLGIPNTRICRSFPSYEKAGVSMLMATVWIGQPDSGPRNLILAKAMRLNWLRLFEKIDKDRMQEYFVEPEHKFIHRGQIYVFCQGCKRWVSLFDFEDYCQKGLHEFSKALESPEVHEDSLPSRRQSGE